MDSEQAIRVHSKGPVPAIAALLATRRAARFNCCRWCCLRPLWAYRISEAQEEVRYALMRERFVAPPSVKVGEVPLPSDFEFSSYLRRRGATLVTQARLPNQATPALSTACPPHQGRLGGPRPGPRRRPSPFALRTAASTLGHALPCCRCCTCRLALGSPCSSS